MLLASLVAEIPSHLQHGSLPHGQDLPPCTVALLPTGDHILHLYYSPLQAKPQPPQHYTLVHQHHILESTRCPIHSQFHDNLPGTPLANVPLFHPDSKLPHHGKLPLPHNAATHHFLQHTGSHLQCRYHPALDQNHAHLFHPLHTLPGIPGTPGTPHLQQGNRVHPPQGNIPLHIHHKLPLLHLPVDIHLQTTPDCLLDHQSDSRPLQRRNSTLAHNLHPLLLLHNSSC